MLTYKIKTITKKVEESVLVQATCDACTKSIPFDDNFPIGVLRFGFSGGYGDYIDGNISGIFCTECANNLRKLFPKIFESYFNGLDFNVTNTKYIDPSVVSE